MAANQSSDSSDRGVRVLLTSKKDRKDLAKIEREKNLGKVVRAPIVRIDCSKGMTIHLRLGARGSDERIENVHTDHPELVDWVTDNGTEIKFISCGETHIAGIAAITYLPKRKGLTMGEPLVVEILQLQD